MLKNKVLSVLIPVFNEEKTIEKLLNKLIISRNGKGIEYEIVIVNDGSKDETEQKVNDFINSNPTEKIIYFKHEKNSGKGSAIHTAIRLCTGEFAIVQDADLEYDPAEYKQLLKPILNGNADVVYGSRFMGGKPHRVLFFFHSIGNKFLTFLSNMTTNLNLTDMETCYKMFKTEHLKTLNLKEKRFGFEPEVTAKISKIPGIRIYEVGISYYGRTYKEGKKINWKDGFRAIYCIIRYGIF